VPFDLSALLPDGLHPMVALGLVVLSFVTSLLTATFSVGGGALMLAVLTVVFPPAVVIPFHGAIQLGSNAGRAVVQRRHVQWRIVLWLGLGAVLGVFFGAQLVSVLPEWLFQIAIGVFLLITTWLPQPRVMISNPFALAIGGFLISALGMVVGAIGPLIAALVRGVNDRHKLVATQAVILTIQNFFKIGAFIALGFAFSAYVPLIVVMLITGVLGTMAGSRLLARVPEKVFQYGFRILLTVLALELLRTAIWP
jgi:uncharacterized membrane protein YfcA